ncbi:Rho termination factor N-terminal domain-containing protein [Shewanella sp. M16]|uniref:HI1506-related protein n=1 Tax=Shewanella sp. M16 TaxID=2830837 RepID=UPI001BAEC915|nr:HI1506-related protein [Shewanella sp. M16]MBS0043354.1 Rho termination factor N-terminal domain-containing protein [Shewanella sp. M16]QYW06228.1 Rho termination factor [Shewanella phage vB_SspS_MuM16-1]
MANPSKNIQVLLVICLAHTGYRRAGMALTKGENLIPLAELSDEQVAAFEADQRLKVSVRDMAPASGSVDIPDGDQALGSDITGTLTGVKEPNAEEKALGELSVKELKELAKDLAITGVNSMNKNDLISAIQAVKVTVPGENETANPGAEMPSTETKGTEPSGTVTNAAGE